MGFITLPGFGHLCCGKRRVAEGRLICVWHWRGNGNGSNKSYHELSGFPMAGPVPGCSMRITSFHSRMEYFLLLRCFSSRTLAVKVSNGERGWEGVWEVVRET